MVKVKRGYNIYREVIVKNLNIENFILKVVIYFLKVKNKDLSKNG